MNKKSTSMYSFDFAAFPKDPEIHWSSLPEVGKPVTVRCLVPDVYPVEKLEIELLKDNHSMVSQNFLELIDIKSKETKSLEFTFTPTEEDIGKAIVCQATLIIDGQPSVKTTPEKMQVYSKYLCVVYEDLVWMHTAKNSAAKVKKELVCSFYTILSH